MFFSKFDVISFIHGLEHFTNRDYPIVLENIKKYLKPNGIFTGALPHKNRFNYRMCPECNHIFEIDGHVSSHNLESLKKIFLDNNFEIFHLSNFNLKYALISSGTLKKMYLYLNYLFNLKQTPKQIEFVVKPLK